MTTPVAHDIAKGGRRILQDRRQFSYTGHIPERRVLTERRRGMDRRNSETRTSGTDLSVSWIFIPPH